MTDTEKSEVYERLIGASIRFVSFRPRSSKEMRDFIARKLKNSHTTAPLVIEEVIARLTDLGYVDDPAFAAWWVTQRTGRKSKGAKAIRIELTGKGIAPEVADGVINEIMKEERSEQVLAKVAALKKYGVWSRLPQAEQKHKLAQYLLRRGFASEIVWSVVDDMVENV